MNAGRPDDEQRLRLVERMGGFLAGNGLRSVVLYDASGKVMLLAGDRHSEEHATMPEVREVVATGQTLLIDLHRHRDPSLPIGMGVLVPLREGDRIYGAVYLAEDPEKYLYPLIHEWPTDSLSAETLLVRKEGGDILYLDKLRHRADAPLTFRLPLTESQLAASVALGGRQGVLEDTLDYRGVPVLAYATPIAGTSWMLVSKIDEDEAYRTVDQVGRVTVVLTLLIFSLIGAWFWQWRRHEHSVLEAALLKERVRSDFLQMEGAKRFRMVFEHTALPMVRNGLNGEFIEVNDAWCEMFGYSRDEVLAQHLSWQMVTHPEDLDPGTKLVNSLLAGEISNFKVEKRYLRKDGQVLWGLLQVTLARDETGAPEYFISAIQDITERKQLEKSLQDNLAILKMALEGAQEAVWEWDLVGGQARFSPQYYTMLGYRPDEFPASQDEWLDRIHPDERDGVISRIREGLARKQDLYIAEYRMRAKDGSYRWIQGRGKVVSFDEDGAPTRMVGINVDITERKQSEQQISFMAYHDKLTGLPNRALLFDRLAQAMARAKREDKCVALLFVDLDGFKAVNDEYGHEAGDAVLRMSAQRFLACVRAVDTVARFGGDEFAIILGNLDAPEPARGVAEKIVQAFAQPMALASGGECKVGASVGISVYPDHGSAMDSLIKAADHAMYESKRRGKNTFSFYSESEQIDNGPWIQLDDSHAVGIEEIDEQHRNLAYLVNRLNDALKHDESKEATELMFDELLLATVHHFDTESRYMTQHQYPDRAAHELAHSNLVETAKQLKRQFQEGREVLALQAVKDWLLGHIAYEDKRLGNFLQKQGVK
jgi:diguanylate cyclase (GGDEF)-like protein/PAS domain S-box-containing protein/hemerythrin-like metal-binding protein